MRTYTWDEYYEKFYDWTEKTQVRNLFALTSLGDADEVAEIIIELQFDFHAPDCLLQKAIEEKVKFSGADLVAFLDFCDEKLVEEAVRNSAERLTADDMEELCGFVDDDIIMGICKARKIALPEELREWDDFDEIEIADEESGVYAEPKKSGFFADFLAGLGVAAFVGRVKKRRQHNGCCNGDCTNCPPHYGYRYGRWYYGHHHQYGCEFDGNKGK